MACASTVTRISVQGSPQVDQNSFNITKFCFHIHFGFLVFFLSLYCARIFCFFLLYKIIQMVVFLKSGERRKKKNENFDGWLAESCIVCLMLQFLVVVHIS